MLLAIITAVFLIAVSLTGGIRNAYAAEEPALTVCKDGDIVRRFTLEELIRIAEEEGDKSYSYSAWNVYPTFSTVTDIKGATVEGILDEAGVLDSLKDTGTVTFYADDDPDTYMYSYNMSLTGSQLREDRFFFPNGNLTDHAGGVIPQDAYDGAEPMPAVIETGNEFRLYVGQTAPNEENSPLFVKNMANGGMIVVSNKTAPKCDMIETNISNLSMVEEGDEISINNISGTSNTEYDKICYTFETSVSPGYGCPIYNCGPKGNPVLVCKPVLSGNGKVTLKVRVKGYGKLDSTLQTFTYCIGDSLTVMVDGETVKSYHRTEDLEQAGNTTVYDYSGYNSFPTWDIKKNKAGIKVSDIIKDATGNNPDEFDDRSTISFTGLDGYSSVFTFDQLFGTERYCFPEGKKGTDNKGGRATEAAYKNSSLVPAIIGTGDNSTFYFGQAAPNDQNFPECVSDMLKLGVIRIDTSPAGKCEAEDTADPESGSVVNIGERISFPFPDEQHKRDKLYYVIDPEEGQVPGYGDTFYYYAANLYPQKLTNPPVLDQPGNHKIAVKVFAYGKQDSDVSVFEYSVKPGKPSGLKVASVSYNSAKIMWNAQKGATGYRIYRAEGSKGLSMYKDIDASATAFADTGLATGVSYKYAVAALTEAGENTLESAKSESISVKPALKKTSVKLSPGKKKIKVKWSKVSGASGYVIMRSTKKGSGYKTVKTVKKGSAVSFTNKKLKKGKKYYYKVRAYRIVNGKKVFGAYSAVRSAKAK